jgi:hypothetical protein
LPRELTLAWQLEHTPKLRELDEVAKRRPLPPGCRSTKEILETLADLLAKARANPAAALQTGLTNDDTRELMLTRSIDTAVHLVYSGFVKHNNLPPDIAV